MTVTWSWDLQAYISGAWTSIARDVEAKRVPVEMWRGINGSSITDRVASPGRLSCQLDNDTSNSAGLLGYYSPRHANMRTGFGRNTNIRLKFTYGGTDYYKFYGYITDLQPTIGQFKDPSSVLIATDYMQRLVEYKLKQLDVQQNKRSDEVVSTILASLPTTPLTEDLEADAYTIRYLLSQEQDEKTTVMGALQKLCQSSMCYFFITGNTTNGETAVYEREATRAGRTSSATLNDTMTDMQPKRSMNDVRNKLIGLTHPIRIDETAETLLYTLENEIRIPAGESITINLQFRDPNSLATRVSGLDIVTALESGTHYRASVYPNSVDNDAASSLTATVNAGGNATSATLENTGTVAIYVNMLKIYGRGVYFYNPVEIVKESGDGDKVGTYDFYYQSDQFRAQTMLNRLHQRASSEEESIESVSFYADANSTLMGYAMTLDIGDKVTIVETATGLNDLYTINNVSYIIETDGTLRCVWGLEPADVAEYFILNSSLLDGAKVLSPY